MPRGIIFSAVLVALACLSLSEPAIAESSWDDIRPDVFGERPINPAGSFVRLEAPVRPEDQSAVPVSMEANFSDGRTIRSVTFIVDENPSPVAAVFNMGQSRSHLKLGTLFRLNTATPVRVVVEASDGKLYMADRYVKFAGGQAACAAPPNGNPEEIAANMGNMTFAPEHHAVAQTEIRPKAMLKVSHPNHTGMVLDQMSLLYIPLRIVSDIEVREGDDTVFTMTGSITLSQDPQVTFDYLSNGAHEMVVKVTDTDGASWAKTFPIGPGS